MALDRQAETVITPPPDYAATCPVTRAGAAEQQPDLLRGRALRRGALPSHSREVLYWKITQSRWQVIVVNVLSLPLAVLMALVFFGGD